MSEIDDTFKPGNLANAGGVKDVDGQTVTLRFVTAAPTFVAGVPDFVWDITANTLYVWDGTNKLTVTGNSTSISGTMV
jgi:hypothetical protein